MEHKLAKDAELIRATHSYLGSLFLRIILFTKNAEWCVLRGANIYFTLENKRNSNWLCKDKKRMWN